MNREQLGLPWRRELVGNFTFYDSSGEVIAAMVPRHEDRANFAITAANAHFPLVEACQAALIALDLSDQDRFDGGKVTSQLRAAIALARVSERGD